MCWTGNSNPIVAKDDIPCKKIVKVLYRPPRKIYVPFFMHAKSIEYVIGETYTSEIRIRYQWEDGFKEIDVGLHCYSKDVKTQHLQTGIAVNFLNNPNGRYYSNIYNPVLMNCIIPKGTTYYENNNGEIVTEKLKIISIE